MLNYRIPSSDRVRRKFFAHILRKHKHSIAIPRDGVARGVKEQKSPAEGRFYSFQAVTEGGDRLKRRGISRSAERDSRLCLENPYVSGGFP